MISVISTPPVSDDIIVRLSIFEFEIILFDSNINYGSYSSISVGSYYEK